MLAEILRSFDFASVNDLPVHQLRLQMPLVKVMQKPVMLMSFYRFQSLQRLLIYSAVKRFFLKRDYAGANLVQDIHNQEVVIFLAGDSLLAMPQMLTFVPLLLQKPNLSKNSLVKHFEDMRLYRPSKEYLQVWFDPPRDESMSCLTIKGMRNNGAKCARLLFRTPSLNVVDVAKFQRQSNNVRHINCESSGKFGVLFSEAINPNDLMFDDADGIESLTKLMLFDAFSAYGI
ncbi:hypothetical protein Tco_0955945 [Tanacetum coccineum]|uniref:Uncharacterized protein n=1 Tax=Tanacetum coccineum TaxID=301880 RepID=A0ABQ5E8M6_9ASTR